MLVRQTIIGSNHHKTVKEIDVTLEELRQDDDLFALPTITARWEQLFSTINVNDKLYTLLEARRTFIPYQCHQSYLAKKSTSLGFEIADLRSLNAQVGDPIAIMSNIHGENLQFFIITAIDGNIIKGLEADYFAGAIVQNLKNKWWTMPPLGIISHIRRPESLPFQCQWNNGLWINVLTPLNPANATCYDVYVRQEKFTAIECHWLPDAADIDIYEPKTLVTTYHGGEECGGGSLVSGTYYISVIAKDKKGRIQVNESIPEFVQGFHIEL